VTVGFVTVLVGVVLVVAVGAVVLVVIAGFVVDVVGVVVLVVGVVVFDVIEGLVVTGVFVTAGLVVGFVTGGFVTGGFVIAGFVVATLEVMGAFGVNGLSGSLTKAGLEMFSRWFIFDKGFTPPVEVMRRASGRVDSKNPALGLALSTSRITLDRGERSNPRACGN
jgi:hypothetical protein